MCSVRKEEEVRVYPDALELSEKCFLTQTWAAVQGGFIFRLLELLLFLCSRLCFCRICNEAGFS